MYCPNCGANNSTEQKFCRSCGLNLERTAESLLLQIPSAESANLLKQERMLEKFGNIVFGGFGIVLLIGIATIIYFVLAQTVLAGKDFFAGILLTAFIVFAALALTYVIFAETLKEKKQKIGFAGNNGDNKLGNAKNTAKLLEEKPFEPVPSVTEKTTDLFLTKVKTKTSGDLN